MVALQIVGAVVAGVLILLVPLLLVIRTARRKIIEKMSAMVDERFAGKTIVRKDLFANGFGQTSRGKTQVRGNGALVLTDTDLWFFLAIPEREVRIPLGAVKEIETKRSHLGKTVGRDLLYVGWKDDDAEDSAAWWVPDVDAWLAALKKQRG